MRNNLVSSSPSPSRKRGSIQILDSRFRGNDNVVVDSRVRGNDKENGLPRGNNRKDERMTKEGAGITKVLQLPASPVLSFQLLIVLIIHLSVFVRSRVFFFRNLGNSGSYSKIICGYRNSVYKSSLSNFKRVNDAFLF